MHIVIYSVCQCCTQRCRIKVGYTNKHSGVKVKLSVSTKALHIGIYIATLRMVAVIWLLAKSYACYEQGGGA